MKELKKSHAVITIGVIAILTFLVFVCIQKVKDYKTNNQIFDIVENMPEFPGGEMALRIFIADSIRYPIEAQEKGIQGKVYIKFVVNKKGKVTNAIVKRGVDPSLDKEALRVINILPDWKPGTQDGKNVNVGYTVPILFKLK